MIAYYNGSFLPVEDVRVSVFDRAYLFADGVYEALRSYNGKLFKVEEHLKRLQYSIKELSIPFEDINLLKELLDKLPKINSVVNENYSIYLQISRGTSFPRSHDYSRNIKPNIFINLNLLKEHQRQLIEGVNVILQKDIRWLRCDIKSTALLPSVLANHNAKTNNAYEAVFYRDNFLTEGSHTNIFMVKDGEVITTPVSDYILAGVTRDVVISICKQNGIPINERFINRDELKQADEFFITGTTTEITPVVKIDDMTLNGGKPGVITRKIQNEFFNLTSRT